MKSRKELEASRERRRGEQKENRAALGGIFAQAGQRMKVSVHNGFIGVIYALCMFLVFYFALQLAFYGVAFIAGTTGAFAMETAADVLTVYVIVAMVCGFDMFFAFGIEKSIIRAMKRRLWKVCGDGAIDKGEAWRERHGEEN